MYARLTDDRVHAERLDAERAVQLLPAAVLGRLDGVLCEIDLWHDISLASVVSGLCPG